MFPSGQSGLRRISKKVARLPSIEQQLLFLWDLHYFLSPLFLSQLNGKQTLRRRFDPRKTGKTRRFLTNQKQEAAQTATNKREKSRLLCSRKPVETLIAINRSGPRDNYMYIHYHRVVLCLSDLMSLRGGKAAGQ